VNIPQPHRDPHRKDAPRPTADPFAAAVGETGMKAARFSSVDGCFGNHISPSKTIDQGMACET